MPTHLSSSKVRLMLTLTPVVCVLSSIAFSKTLETYLEQDENMEVEKEKGKKKSPSHGDDDSDEDEYAQSRLVEKSFIPCLKKNCRFWV